MVAHWFHWLADFATTWLPLAFFVVMVNLLTDVVHAALDPRVSAG